MRKSDPTLDLTIEDATTTTPEADDVPSDAEPPFDMRQFEDDLGDIIGAERRRARGELDATIAPLVREISELKGQVTALLAIVGGDKAKSVSQTAASSVVDLPHGFIRRRTDAA